jgi:hypothetical protein
MRKLMGLKVGLLVVCLLMAAAVPAKAQLADPLSLAASGVLLPFFSDGAAGFVSVFEIASPVVPTVQGNTFPFDFTNPIHAIFFTATCARNGSIGDEQTAKQAKTYISSASPLLLNFNGLAAIARTINNNDLVPLNFPIHTRTHWIDVKTGRLRELEPITLDNFLQLNAAFLPLVVDFGVGASIGLCVSGPTGAGALPSEPFNGTSNGFCWNPLRSAATFVTPQDSATIKASIVLICPRGTIQSKEGLGVFRVSPVLAPGGTLTAGGFPRLVNRDGSFGFNNSDVITGNSVTRLRGRIFDDDETLVRDIEVPCDCLTNTPVVTIDTIYSLPPKNLGAHTVPVWYTELESQARRDNTVGIPTPALQHNSFTGYWNLEVTGHEGTLFHRMSNASLDNLSNGFSNAAPANR